MKRYFTFGVLCGLAVLAVSSSLGAVQNGALPPGPTFTKDVLPILQENCQSCHRPGQIAPMSLLTYEQVRPWARAIKAKVISRQMPPWFADPAHGKFRNDRSLTQRAINVIASWVDAGAPMGNPKDAPAAKKFPEAGWDIEPDYVVRGPDFLVAANPPSNVLEWVSITTPSGLTKDTWITSMEVKPTALSAAHHICVGFKPHSPNIEYYKPTWSERVRDEEGVVVPTDTAETRPPAGVANQGDPSIGGQQICYLPGNQSQDYRPYQAGKLVPAGAALVWSMHYTPIGRELVDKIELGLTVAKTPPKNRYLNITLGSTRDPKVFAIPPNEPNWKSPPAQVVFNSEVQLVAVIPHMHVRGKDMTYNVIYPDGRKETAIRITPFDYNWQQNYEFEKPIRLPKGTTMHVDAHFNNSSSNKANPNPNRTVYWGDMAWEEMMSPFFSVVVPRDVDPKTLLKLNLGTEIDESGG